MRKPTFWSPTWSDTNQAVQPQKLARGLKFRIKEVDGLYYPCSENKALISFAITAKLICVFVFAYAKSRFSHDAAQLKLSWFNRSVHYNSQGDTRGHAMRNLAFCICEKKAAGQVRGTG